MPPLGPDVRSQSKSGARGHSSLHTQTEPASFTWSCSYIILQSDVGDLFQTDSETNEGKVSRHRHRHKKFDLKVQAIFCSAKRGTNVNNEMIIYTNISALDEWFSQCGISPPLGRLVCVCVCVSGDKSTFHSLNAPAFIHQGIKYELKCEPPLSKSGVTFFTTSQRHDARGSSRLARRPSVRRRRDAENSLKSLCSKAPQYTR